MTSRQLQGAATALAAVASLAVAVPASAHDAAGEATDFSQAAVATMVDPDEVAAIGNAHAQEHARGRLVEQRARSRWESLTPQQRATQIARAERQTQAINRALGDRPRDDAGYWEPALRALPEYAIHASMLPTGKILIFGREPISDPSQPRSNLGSASVFDPATGTSVHVPPPPLPENAGMAAPLFCVGQALLSDGRVLLAGGNLSEPSQAGNPAYSGLKRTFIFDPWTLQWELGPDMTRGRWYPTMTKLSSGDVLIAGGLDEDGQGLRNPFLDIYRPGQDRTTPVLDPFRGGTRGPDSGQTLPPDAQIGLSLYPNLYLMPNAHAILGGPGRHDSAVLDTTVAQNRNSAPGSAWRQIPATQPSQHHYGGAPLLEPNVDDYDGSWSLLDMAGADGSGSDVWPARATVDRLTVGRAAGGQAMAAGSVWSHDPNDDLNQARFYLNNVILPDAGVVVIGGGTGADYATPSSPQNWDVFDPATGTIPPALKQVELRRPGERTWRVGAAQQEFRTYHSTALLLPDGRVWSAGDDGHEGNPGGDPAQSVPASVRQDSAEFYWPPNLFDGDDCALRPAIRAVGGVGAAAVPIIAYGEQFGISSEHAQPGMRAVLVAPAAVTHSIDMNQRFVPLRIAATLPAGGLNVAAPGNGAIAPPGYYMLFVVDGAGTPSTATWVRLLGPGDAAIAARPGAPALVTGTWPGARGRSCTNPDGSVRSEPDPPTPTPTPTPTSATTTTPPPPPPAPPKAVAKQTAKLDLRQATIERRRRELKVFAGITGLASGSVRIELLAAGRRVRWSAKVDSKRRRVLLTRRITAAQARTGTGILTLTYRGDADTRSQRVRLRVAPRRARLVVKRPTLRSGRLRAAGTIARGAAGVVRVQLQYEHRGRTVTVERNAKIERGAWKLDTGLSAPIRRQIAERTGTVHSYTLFTGDGRARISGEMRSYQVLGNR